jgi:cysteine-rich repeat protein
MHMHLVMFQVLDRQAFEEQGGLVVPIGSPVPPPAHEAGWKDTVQVGPNEIVRVIARFEGYTGKYAYHCHILEHEDHEMMRQFQTVQCGNGLIEPGETCDDSNTAPGDGCDAACQVEAGWTCNGEPSLCQLCGNGIIEGTEACDDSNTAPGDGCDAACQVEAGWTCNGEPSLCQLCGNGIIEGTETCDDSNTAPGDGCDAACQVEAGWTCNGQPSLCQLCGNGIIEGTETCDDSNTVGGDCCAADCTLEVAGFSCDDGLFCNVGETCDGAGNCGGGSPNACDDGVGCTGDACDEVGDVCVNTPVDAACDDGQFCNGTETCDAVLDCQAGTPVDCSDGVGCTVDACNEVTDSCDNTPNNALCDDALFCNGTETCDAVLDCQAGTPVDCDDADICTDDACNEGTDQCDNLFDPTNDPSCEPSVCGNGLVEGLEGCDDNNTSPDDGCNAACQVELGWTCTGEPSVCSGSPIPALSLPGLALFLLLLFGGTRHRRR